MKLAGVLAGRDGLAGLRWLLLDPHPHRILRRELERMLADGYELGRCRLRRAKFKPGRKLSAYFDVEVRKGVGRATGIRAVAVTWTADGDPPPAGELVELEAEAVDRGLAAPFRSLEGRVEPWGMHLLVSPLDTRFPDLIPLSDAAFVADVIGGSGGPRYTVRTVRYRPGQRHVLRYDPCASRAKRPPAAVVFAKLYEDERGRRELRVARELGEALAGVSTEFAVPSPLAYLPEQRTLLYRQVPGAPLSEQLQSSADPKGQLRRAAALLRCIHAAPPELVEDHRHELDVEIGAVARASEHIAALSPATGAAIQAVLARVQAFHTRLPQERVAFVHGDFKLDHLCAAPGALTVLDLDRCCAGDPALDIGKLLADLRWWYTGTGGDFGRGRWQFLDGYFGERTPPRLLRARLYEALLLVKIAARRVPLFEPGWQMRTDALVAQAEHALADLEHDLRLRRIGSRSEAFAARTS